MRHIRAPCGPIPRVTRWPNRDDRAIAEAHTCRRSPTHCNTCPSLGSVWRNEIKGTGDPEPYLTSSPPAILTHTHTRVHTHTHTHTHTSTVQDTNCGAELYTQYVRKVQKKTAQHNTVWYDMDIYATTTLQYFIPLQCILYSILCHIHRHSHIPVVIRPTDNKPWGSETIRHQHIPLIRNTANVQPLEHVTKASTQTATDRGRRVRVEDLQRQPAEVPADTRIGPRNHPEWQLGGKRRGMMQAEIPPPPPNIHTHHKRLHR